MAFLRLSKYRLFMRKLNEKAGRVNNRDAECRELLSMSIPSCEKNRKSNNCKIGALSSTSTIVSALLKEEKGVIDFAHVETRPSVVPFHYVGPGGFLLVFTVPA